MSYIDEMLTQHTMQLFSLHFRETCSKSYETEKENLRHFKFNT